MHLSFQKHILKGYRLIKKNVIKLTLYYRILYFLNCSFTVKYFTLSQEYYKYNNL